MEETCFVPQNILSLECVEEKINYGQTKKIYCDGLTVFQLRRKTSYKQCFGCGETDRNMMRRFKPVLLHQVIHLVVLLYSTSHLMWNMRRPAQRFASYYVCPLLIVYVCTRLHEEVKTLINTPIPTWSYSHIDDNYGVWHRLWSASR